jgi:hypothetical protein
MTTVTELLASARTLPREERAELANELIGTLATQDIDDSARLAALRQAVNAAEDSIAAGRVDRVPADGLRDYIRQVGREAASVVNARTP